MKEIMHVCSAFARLLAMEFLKPDATYSFATIGEFSFEDAQSEFVDVLNKSGYFAALTEGDGGDIHIKAQLEARIINTWRGSEAWQQFSAPTGPLIPVWGTEKFDMTAQVVTKDHEEKTYSLTDSVTTVLRLPRVIANTFKIPARVKKEVRENIWKTLIFKMQQDGFLPTLVSDEIFDFSE
jgi:hypothetical protein